MGKVKCILIVFVLFSGLVYSGEDKKDQKQSWMDKLIKKIEIKLNRMKNENKRPDLVIGVRGNKFDSENRLYWKNEYSRGYLEKYEKDSIVINEAIGMIEKGEFEKSVKMLKNFLKENPNSPLKKEAEEIINQISDEKTEKSESKSFNENNKDKSEDTKTEDLKKVEKEKNLTEENKSLDKTADNKSEIKSSDNQ